MNKTALKLWIECKIDTLTFRKAFSKDSTTDIDAQLLILKELYEDFNLQDVQLEFIQGI